MDTPDLEQGAAIAKGAMGYGVTGLSQVQAPAFMGPWVGSSNAPEDMERLAGAAEKLTAPADVG